MTSATIHDLRALRRAISLLLPLAGPKMTSIPIINYLKVDISQGKVALSGTNLDMELRLDLEAETDGADSFLIPFQILRKFGAWASGPVTISSSERRETRQKAGKSVEHKQPLTTITDGTMTLNSLRHMDVSDWPKTDFPEAWSSEISAPQDTLARLIRLSKHCISTEETRYYLHGIFLTEKPGSKTLRAVATDGHRMAIIDSDLPVLIAPP